MFTSFKDLLNGLIRFSAPPAGLRTVHLCAELRSTKLVKHLFHKRTTGRTLGTRCSLPACRAYVHTVVPWTLGASLFPNSPRPLGRRRLVVTFRGRRCWFPWWPLPGQREKASGRGARAAAARRQERSERCKCREVREGAGWSGGTWDCGGPRPGAGAHTLGRARCLWPHAERGLSGLFPWVSTQPPPLSRQTLIFCAVQGSVRLKGWITCPKSHSR